MKINRREFGKTLTTGLGSSMLDLKAFSQGQPGAVRRPNILFICSDEHNGRLLMGGPGKASPAMTPNLERLASMGVYFRNAYTANPVCAPARAAFMTGRFASDVGSYCNSTAFDGRVPTWGNYLRNAGYYCWATGKLDLTPEADLGFVQHNTSSGHFSNRDITSLFRRPLCYRIDNRKSVDGKVAEHPKAHDVAVTGAGLNFLQTQAGSLKKPWAAYLGMTLPHPAFTTTQKYWDLYPPDTVSLPNIPPGYLENLPLVYQALRNFDLMSTPIPEERVRRARSAYYGMVTELDANIGRVLDQLEKTDALKDTLVIYTSDHGEMLGNHGLWLKDVLFEGAAHVPLFMAGAGLPRGKVIDTPVSHLDMVPTMLDLAGAPIPSALRGHSLLPMIFGKESDYHGHVFAESHGSGKCTGSFMIRQGKWKYIYFSWYNDNLLFNLDDDPEELINLAGKPEFASVRRELHGVLTSLVDPDKVAEQAFEAQHQVLQQILKDPASLKTKLHSSAHQQMPVQLPKDHASRFCLDLIYRLGPGQAAALTKKYFPEWEMSPVVEKIGQQILSWDNEY